VYICTAHTHTKKIVVLPMIGTKRGSLFYLLIL
jgi:hypothetical protein